MRRDRENGQGADPRRGVSAYVAALAMLARRELSESQIRQRLGRRGYEAGDIDTAVTRLKGERAIDDRRTAEAIARSETSLKRRGKLRVRQQIQRAGIRGDAAREALDTVFEGIDDEALLAAALSKRLRGDARIEDDRTFQRLYRYLVSQGFEHDRVIKALRDKKR
jgi:regulatory protein